MTKKIAISLPDSTLKKAQRAIKERKAPNVSNYIARLIEDASDTESFDQMLAQWIMESGATDEEIRAAHEESREAFERAGLVSEGKKHEKRRRKTA